MMAGVLLGSTDEPGPLGAMHRNISGIKADIDFEFTKFRQNQLPIKREDGEVLTGWTPSTEPVVRIKGRWESDGAMTHLVIPPDA